MNWTLFWILLIVGIAIYVAIMFFSQRQIAYMSVLLYRQGDADAYLKELDSWQTRLFFNKRLRKMMEIDPYMLKNDTDRLRSIFAEIATYRLADGDRMTVLEKQMSFEMSGGNLEKASEIFTDLENLFNSMSDKQKAGHEDAMKECRYIKAIRLDKSGKYADELFQKAKNVKDPIPSGVYYLKAAQSYVLKKDIKNAEEMLNRAEVKLRGTPYNPEIRNVLQTKNYEAVLQMRI
ncbi:MAG: hypothetical protein EOM64_01050 [Erysipelotrichia bacterium]|nr:hypothetical protein [Erysipelotrichia bacterium]